MGNVFSTGLAPAAGARSPDLDRLEDRFDTTAYLSPYSDVVALLVLEHQHHLTNLLTRLNWETRAAAYEAQSGGPTGRPVRFPIGRLSHRRRRSTRSWTICCSLTRRRCQEPFRARSGFAEQFAQRGPFDGRGRSLRQFDLQNRLLRYRCSYMIYSPAFDGLPAAPREAVYRRMWQILSGNERSAKYARLSPDDRGAILQILRETKKGLPDYFGG